MLEIPPHVAALGVRGVKPTFKGVPNFGDAQSNSTPLSREITLARKRTYRWRLGYAAACVDWIAWRLDGVTEVGPLKQFAESMWAAVVDYRNAWPAWRPDDQDSKRRKPPIPGNKEDRGALAYVVYEAFSNANAVYLKCCASRDSWNALVSLSVLARHVLPKRHQSNFLKLWVVPVFARGKKLWAIDPDEADPGVAHGAPVPREAFDPGFELDPKQCPALVARFVAVLDPKRNPYLSGPSEKRGKKL